MAGELRGCYCLRLLHVTTRRAHTLARFANLGAAPKDAFGAELGVEPESKALVHQLKAAVDASWSQPPGTKGFRAQGNVAPSDGHPSPANTVESSKKLENQG